MSASAPRRRIVVAAALSWSLRHGPSPSRAEIPPDERRSGYEDMSRDNKAMQDDDTANPGDAGGARRRGAVAGQGRRAGKSCADCHGDAQEQMKGVAARYPAFDAGAGRPVNLEQRINICRTEQQKAHALRLRKQGAAGADRLSRRCSRAASRSRRRTTRGSRRSSKRAASSTTARQGQLNLSCGQCHDDNWGKRLAGNTVPQAHPTGYPIYRLEWQSLGSLQRRLRNCLIGMRAEPYAYGAPEYVDMELYLMWRARGMKLETPAVRP